MIKRVNREKREKHLKKMALRHLQRYKWKLAEIRSGGGTLTKKEKWILKKALWAEGLLKDGHA